MEYPDKSKEIKQNLENQFQKLNEDTKIPENLKKEVFNTLDTLTLLGDFVDLFTVKFGQSKAGLIDTIRTDDD